MILRIFEYRGLYHFRAHDAPQSGSPPAESIGVRVPSQSKFAITRAVIEAAWAQGITVDGVTGRLADKEAARGCGVAFKDTRRNREGTPKVMRKDAVFAHQLYHQKRITRDELNFKLGTPRSQWPLYRPGQPDWRLGDAD